jgi:hypothetical protein
VATGRPHYPMRPVPHAQVRPADADRLLPHVCVHQQLRRGSAHHLH